LLKDMKLYEFLDGLASPSPTPGGGSASALLCSIGASLVCMVCHLSIGKKGCEESEPELRKILEEAEVLRKKAEGLIDEDTGFFNKVIEAYKTPKENPEREGIIENALKDACSTPLEVARTGVRVMELSKVVAFKGNVNSVSDAGVAAFSANAAVRGAIFNVRINLKTVKDEKFVGSKKIELSAIEEKARILLEEVNGIVSFKVAN
jgi:formiminotetrahydrofolate cyclodeaminase